MIPPARLDGDVGDVHGVASTRAALARWGVSAPDDEECREVALRLRVLCDTLEVVMAGPTGLHDPRALVPPGVLDRLERR